MMPKLITEKLRLEDMTCVSCERLIENTLNKKKGVERVKASYSKGIVEITYIREVIQLTEIKKAIENIGYKVMKNNELKVQSDVKLKLFGIGIIIISLYIIINRLGGLTIFNYFPQAKEGMGYGMLFVIGLLTSVHCVAMCGGINLSQVAKLQLVKDGNEGKIQNLIPGMKYNLGRVISYTVIGGIIGALGNVISLTGRMQGVVAIIAGVFMAIMGINMLNIFPSLRKFNISIPRIFSSKKDQESKNNNTLYVGLLNGLMPCGPLQAMQLFALSTASPVVGALSMFFFSLGTVPLMFGLGALSSILTKRFKSKMTAISGVLVVILGIVMFNNGMNLSGISIGINALENTDNTISSSTTNKKSNSIASIHDGVQIITTKLSSGRYEPITVQKGIPVKWIITAKKQDINGCNNTIINQKFNIKKKLIEGENIIEFTPLENGKFIYSCWMGMITSSISVVDDINK